MLILDKDDDDGDGDGCVPRTHTGLRRDVRASLPPLTPLAGRRKRKRIRSGFVALRFAQTSVNTTVVEGKEEGDAIGDSASSSLSVVTSESVASSIDLARRGG